MAAMYETLRAEVLLGNARPDGLGAVAYHGLLGGMTLLAVAAPQRAVPTLRASASTAVTRDPKLLHLLANMVLQTQSEVMHVY